MQFIHDRTHNLQGRAYNMRAHACTHTPRTHTRTRTHTHTHAHTHVCFCSVHIFVAAARPTDTTRDRRQPAEMFVQHEPVPGVAERQLRGADAPGNVHDDRRRIARHTVRRPLVSVRREWPRCYVPDCRRYDTDNTTNDEDNDYDGYYYDKGTTYHDDNNTRRSFTVCQTV